MKTDPTSYSRMKRLCLTLDRLGLAPWGLNIAKYKYFAGKSFNYQFVFKFWKDGEMDE